jgi:hypothetical protein
MARKRLADIFALDATQESSDAAGEPSNSHVPTLDERVALFLRAVHQKHDFSQEEYTRARRRILEVMAADIAARPEFDREPAGGTVGFLSRLPKTPAVIPEVRVIGGGPQAATLNAPIDVLIGPSDIPLHLRVAGIFLRTIFVSALLVITIRVATPQSETLWSLLDSPGDLIRVVLGFIACIWIVAHLFMLPKDAEGYRTWVYLGLALVPLALACAIAVW